MEILEDELYMSLVGMIAFSILSAVTLKVYSKVKGKILLFYSLSWLCNTIYLTVETLGFALLNPLAWKMSYVVLSLSFLLWMLFIDYAFADGISWKRFSVGAVYCAVFMFWALMPDNNVTITTQVQDGQLLYVYDIPSELLYVVLFNLYTVLYSVTFVYWNVGTLRAIPDEKRTEARVMLTSGILMLVMSVLFFVMDLNIITEFKEEISTLTYVLFLFSSTFTTIIIYRFPKITHLLPYRVYRLLVMSKGGVPYVEYKWTEQEIHTVLLSGLFSAIGTISRNITEDASIKTGHVRSVRLDNMEFLMEPKYSPVTVGLVTSRTSNDLRDSLANFTDEFIEMYKTVLYDKDGFVAEIDNQLEVFKDDDIIPLIKRHFPNVPNYIPDGVTTEELMETITK